MSLIYQFGTDFSAPAEWGTRTAAGGFAPNGRGVFRRDSAVGIRRLRTAGRRGARRGGKKEGQPAVFLPL